jgi:hypothetical protein
LKTYLLFTVFLSLGICSCKKRDFNSSDSQAKMAFGQVSPSHFSKPEHTARYWTDVTSQMTNDPVFRKKATKGNELLPDSHPALRRIQDHAQRLHSLLLNEKAIPPGLPAPKIYIVRTPEKIARSLGAAQCFQRGFSPDLDWNQVPQEMDAGVKATEALMGTVPPGTLRTPCQLSTDEDVQWLLAHLPPDPLGVCNYFLKNDVVMGNTRCFKRRVSTASGDEVEVDFDQNWKSKTISWGTSTNAILFSDAFILSFGKEEEFLAVAFHEMAHYYRNHSSTLAKNSPFFSFAQNNARNEDPVPVEKSKLSRELQEAYDLFLVSDRQTIDYEPLPQLAYQLPVWDTLESIFVDSTHSAYLPARCSRGGCPRECDAALSIAKSPLAQSTLKSLSFVSRGHRRPQEKAVAHLRSLTPDIQRCFEKLPFSELKTSVNRDRILEWQVSDALNFHSALVNFQEFVELRLSQRKKAWKQLADSGLRMHSAESEADALAIHFMMRSGINPSHAVDANLTLTGIETFASLGTVGFQQCHKLARQGFKNPDGSWVQMLPVNTLDSHFQGCWRAYSAAQEIEAHANKMPAQFNSFDAKEWHDVRKSLQSH